MNGILQQIIDHKRIEVEQSKQTVSLNAMMTKAYNTTHSTRSMKEALQNSPSGIIAEFKRKSPSKGWMFQTANPTEIARGYESAGAAAMSILTDNRFFGGSVEDFAAARALVKLPLLRKEFIIDPYQLYEAKAMGADAILLIATCLTPDNCLTLAKLAHDLRMEVLLEIHIEAELSHFNPYVDMLGVNNRNLDTFQTDVNTSLRIVETVRLPSQQCTTSLPPETLLVSESGISSPETIRQLRQAGFKGFLMGETFMKTENPAHTLRQFIREIKN